MKILQRLKILKKYVNVKISDLKCQAILRTTRISFDLGDNVIFYIDCSKLDDKNFYTVGCLKSKGYQDLESKSNDLGDYLRYPVTSKIMGFLHLNKREVLEDLKKLGVLSDAPYVDTFCYSKVPLFPYDKDLELLLSFELYAKMKRIIPSNQMYEEFIGILNKVEGLTHLKMKVKGDLYLFCLEFNLDYTVNSYTQYESYVNDRKQALSRIWCEEMLEDIKRSRLYQKLCFYTILERICIINEELRFKPIDSLN